MLFIPISLDAPSIILMVAGTVLFYIRTYRPFFIQMDIEEEHESSE